MNRPKYPNIAVPLLGENGNAAAIVGRTMKAMRRNAVSEEEIEVFRKEAVGGNYDNVLQTVMRWVETSPAAAAEHAPSGSALAGPTAGMEM